MTAALVIALLAAGDAIPNAPMPNGREIVAPARPAMRRGAFWTRSTKIEAAAMAGLAAADMTQTCRNLRIRGWHEDLLTQSCGKDVAITIGFEAAAVGGAWLLHRTGHDRLAKLPMMYMAAQSARGLTW